MKLTEFAEFLLCEAKFYRNGLLSTDVVPELTGQMITEELVKKLLDPFLVAIKPMLDTKLQAKLISRLEEFAPLALDCMYENPDMHEGDETCLLNQNNADAILTMFLSIVCKPLIFDLNSKDLLIKEEDEE